MQEHYRTERWRIVAVNPTAWRVPPLKHQANGYVASGRFEVEGAGPAGEVQSSAATVGNTVMAKWYRLGCLQCRVFVDLHKFLPADAWYARFDHERYDFDLFPGHPTYCVVKVDSAKLLNDVAVADLRLQPKYVRRLVAGLSEFIPMHHHHQLFLISDSGDEPWDIGTEGWWRWKEIPVEFDFHSYLPRCLVEEMGIADWPSAVRALKNHPSGFNPPLDATTGDALEFRLGFERALEMWIAKLHPAAGPCGD